MARDHGRTGLTIRPEQPGEEHTVRAVHACAFPTDNEARLVDALRVCEAFIPGLSLVAVEAAEIVGHILLSRVAIEGERSGRALALAPVAVHPDHQGTGIGSALIRAAIDEARRCAEPLIVLVGHANYYPRFGFVRAAPLGINPPFEVSPEVWMALPLDPNHPRGTVRYPPPFDAL